MKKYILKFTFLTLMLIGSVSTVKASRGLTITSVTTTTPNPLLQGQTNIMLYAGSVYSSGSQSVTITGLTFTGSENINDYFSTANIALYITNNALLTGGTKIASTATGGSTVGVTGANLSFTFATQTVGSGNTSYFYIVVTFDTATGVIPNIFELDYSGITTNAAAANVTSAGTTTNGKPFNLDGPVGVNVASGASGGTATLASNPIITIAPATSYGIFGFSVGSVASNTFKTFILNSVQSSGTIGTFFTASSVAIYRNTTNSLTGATQITTTTDPGFSITVSGTTITVSNLTQTISNATVYYFIKATYIVNTTTVNTFQLNLTSVATSAITYNATTYPNCGFPVNGTNYTLAPKAYLWRPSASYLWENGRNWVNLATNTTNNGYPTTSTDIAVFSGVGGTGYCYSNANETISQIIVGENYNGSIYLYYNNQVLQATNGITVSDASQVIASSNTTSYITFSPYYNGNNATFQFGGTSTFYPEGQLTIAQYATVNFLANSIVNINSTVADQAAIFVSGKLTSANPSTITMTGGNGLMYDNATGTISLSGATVNMGGYSPEFWIDGGIGTLTGSTVNVTGTVYNDFVSGLAVDDGGALTATSSSAIYLGTASSNGSGSLLYNIGGTFNLTATSSLNLLGPNAIIYNDYIDNTGTGVNNYAAIYNITNSIINLGSLGGADGLNAEIDNTDRGFFNLGAGSTINMNGANSEILNTFPATTTDYAGFVCASTSVINPTNVTAVIENDNGASFFNLLSDNTVTGSLGAAATIGTFGTSAKMTGQYNVQRYISGGSTYFRNYVLLSSPTNTVSVTPSSTNTINLGYLGSPSTYYTGYTTNTNREPTATSATTLGAYIAGPLAGFPHIETNSLIYLYQESILPGVNFDKSFTSGKNVSVQGINTTPGYNVYTKSTASGGTTPSDNSTTSPGVLVPPGNAYLLYYIGNSSSAVNATTPTASTLVSTGYINQGTIQLYMWGITPSATLTYNYDYPQTTTGQRFPGNTMVGNPYPSTIDLVAVYNDNSTAIIPTFYTLDATTHNFDTFNATPPYLSSTSISDRYVGSGQGFYIHVDSSQSTPTSRLFYFEENQKTAGATFPLINNMQSFPVAPVKTIDSVTVPRVSVRNDNLLIGHPITAANIADVPSGTSAASAVGVGSASANLIPHRIIHLIKPTIFPTSTTVTPRPPSSSTPVAPPAQKNNPNNSPTILATGLHLKLVVDSINNDECGIYFSNTWSDNFESYDSADIDGLNGIAMLSSYTADNVRTSVNAMGDYTKGKRIKLYVVAATTGIYQLQLEDLTNFKKGQYSVFLIDNMLKDSLDLTLYKSYNFNYTAGDTSEYANRFVLAIEHKPIPHYALLSFTGAKSTDGVLLNWKTVNEESYTKFVLQKLNANNDFIFLDSLQSDSVGAYSYTDQHPTLGNNIYRLEQINSLGDITYSAPVTIGYNSTSPNGDLTIYPNPSKSIITVTLVTSSDVTTVATADIFNTSGTLIEHKVVNNNSFTLDISSYNLGVYIIELKNSNGLLVGKSKFVKIN